MTEFRVGKMYRTDGKPVVLPPAMLADGQRFRVPVMLRDNNTATCVTCNDTGRHPAGIRCPDCGGKNLGKDSQLTDAETQMRDFIARDEAWRKSSQENRAGFRYAADTEATRALRQQLHDAYAEHERYITTAYRDVSPDVDWSTGAGAPARRFSNPEGGAKEGDPCMTDDKRVGTLQRTAAGDLVCVASGSEDSRTLDQKVAAHRQIMDAEYKNYEAQIGSAWKKI
jgi:hypothetical protein